MTTSTSVDIGTLIKRVPGVQGDAPCIAGTRMPVGRIASFYNGGMTPEEIAEDFEGLQLAHIYAALAYYFANKQEVDDDNAEQQRAYDEAAAAQAKRMAEGERF